MSTPHPQRESIARSRRIDPALLVGIEGKIDECHQISHWKRVAEVAPFGAIYLGGAWLATTGGDKWPMLVIAVVVMGVAMNALGILIHDGLHGLLARSAVANHFWGFLCGLPILMSATAYRKTHTDHHFEFGRAMDLSLIHISEPTRPY